MERARWTDERLDVRMAVIDERFERGFEEMRAMHEEMHAGFVALRGEIVEMRGDISEVRGSLLALQQTVTQIVAGFAIALLGVVAAGVTAAITAAL
jgi:hypothetical protein